MELEPLNNARWGFASNCFVCEDANDEGLRVRFFCDRDRGAVVADFTLSDAFSGAPRYLHGGVVAAVLDEATAWAAIALGESFAVTRQLRVTYELPVHVARPHRVEARLGSDAADGARRATAVVMRPDGTVCAIADAELVVLGEAQARDAIGGGELGDARAFLRG
jgi:acyl-coenzyme A thioesterase PaaI-like protein